MYISPTRLRCLFLLATNLLLYLHKTFMLSVPFHPPFQVWARGGGWGGEGERNVPHRAHTPIRGN
jgi:hypothetical protein